MNETALILALLAIGVIAALAGIPMMRGFAEGMRNLDRIERAMRAEWRRELLEEYQGKEKAT